MEYIYSKRSIWTLEYVLREMFRNVVICVWNVLQLLSKIVKGTYGKSEKDAAPFGYDYWYQPYHNVMISTEWGHPRCFTKGLDVADVAAVRILQIWQCLAFIFVQKI